MQLPTFSRICKLSKLFHAVDAILGNIQQLYCRTNTYDEALQEIVSRDSLAFFLPAWTNTYTGMKFTVYADILNLVAVTIAIGYEC